MSVHKPPAALLRGTCCCARQTVLSHGYVVWSHQRGLFIANDLHDVVNDNVGKCTFFRSLFDFFIIRCSRLREPKFFSSRLLIINIYFLFLSSTFVLRKR
jgi:hypothetical protein